MVNFLENLLKKNNIESSRIGDTIKGSEATIIPVIIKGEKIYFKILDISYFPRIKKEFEIVEILNKQGLKIQKYFTKNGQYLFIENDLCVYGTYDAGKIQTLEDITDSFIEECIANIAKMHKLLESVKLEDSLYPMESDIERFAKFCINNREFFEKYNLKKYVEKLLEVKYKNSNLIYIHSDLNFRNITNKGVIIDFTDMKIGCKEDDIGKFYQNILNTRFSSIDYLNKYLGMYEKITGRKLNLERLKFSIVYRMIYRFYMSIEENADIENEYKNLILNLEKLDKWKENFANDKRSGL